jgi:hypothetical protein
LAFQPKEVTAKQKQFGKVGELIGPMVQGLFKFAGVIDHAGEDL